MCMHFLCFTVPRKASAQHLHDEKMQEEEGNLASSQWDAPISPAWPDHQTALWLQVVTPFMDSRSPSQALGGNTLRTDCRDTAGQDHGENPSPGRWTPSLQDKAAGKRGILHRKPLGVGV